MRCLPHKDVTRPFRKLLNPEETRSIQSGGSACGTAWGGPGDILDFVPKTVPPVVVPSSLGGVPNLSCTSTS